MTSTDAKSIEQAFFEMGLSERTWGKLTYPDPALLSDSVPEKQIFIRLQSTTEPLKEVTANVDLAYPVK